MYKSLIRPLLFSLNPEFVHDLTVFVGEYLEDIDLSKNLLKFLFCYQNKNLQKGVLGINFPNPLGLAAGYDYNGHLAATMADVGFGFNTIGTVTFCPYDGNKKPRLVRLQKSQALLVNKGFKSEGAIEIEKRLDKKNFEGKIIGLSVGSSNIPSVNTIPLAIDDYLSTFNIFKDKKYLSYFELNISCPNTSMPESFVTSKNFRLLVNAVKILKITKPIFVKMPNELPITDTTNLVRIATDTDIRGFIFSNLVKNRKNPDIDQEEIKTVANLKGNISGKPTFKNSNNLVREIRKKFAKNIAIIGCGGIFSPADALEKLSCGADLIQLITGMIYEGPGLAKRINQEIVKAHFPTT